MEMPGKTYQSTAYRYGMNTQEKDNEIYGPGNTLGALYWEYDARIARRWNVDPRPNISISFYSCFKLNPVSFADILGDTIRIKVFNNNTGKDDITTYTPGMKLTGNENSFVIQTVNALNKLNEGEAGSKMISELNDTNSDIFIQRTSENSAVGLEIGFNPDQKVHGMDMNGSVFAPNFVGLGHELAHTLDFLNGTFDSSIWLNNGDEPIREAEKFASHVENQIRAEHGLPLRTHYALTEFPDGHYEPWGKLINGNSSVFFKTKVSLENPNPSLLLDKQKNSLISIMGSYIYLSK
jgi:hypothetical protein